MGGMPSSEGSVTLTQSEDTLTTGASDIKESNSRSRGSSSASGASGSGGSMKATSDMSETEKTDRRTKTNWAEQGSRSASQTSTFADHSAPGGAFSAGGWLQAPVNDDGEYILAPAGYQPEYLRMKGFGDNAFGGGSFADAFGGMPSSEGSVTLTQSEDTMTTGASDIKESNSRSRGSSSASGASGSGGSMKATSDMSETEKTDRRTKTNWAEQGSRSASQTSTFADHSAPGGAFAKGGAFSAGGWLQAPVN